jgi:hypothetical protein
MTDKIIKGMHSQNSQIKLVYNPEPSLGNKDMTKESRVELSDEILFSLRSILFYLVNFLTGFFGRMGHLCRGLAYIRCTMIAVLY